jgi:uncharacterized membrane protein
MSDAYQPVLILLHVLGVVIWVGGMIFMHFFVRPATADLPPQVRLPLLENVLGRFFVWVAGAIVVILVSGALMAARMGADVTLSVKLMSAIGVVMMLLFGHIRFALYPKLRRAVQTQNWAEGAQRMGQLRRWVGINLVLGVINIVVAVVL